MPERTPTGPVSADALGLDPLLLEVVRCPVCRGTLAVDRAAETLTCAGCARAYPVREGVPVLLSDEATMRDGTVEPGGPDPEGDR